MKHVSYKNKGTSSHVTSNVPRIRVHSSKRIGAVSFGPLMCETVLTKKSTIQWFNENMPLSNWPCHLDGKPELPSEQPMNPISDSGICRVVSTFAFTHFLVRFQVLYLSHIRQPALDHQIANDKPTRLPPASIHLTHSLISQCPNSASLRREEQRTKTKDWRKRSKSMSNWQASNPTRPKAKHMSRRTQQNTHEIQAVTLFDPEIGNFIYLETF